MANSSARRWLRIRAIAAGSIAAGSMAAPVFAAQTLVEGSAPAVVQSRVVELVNVARSRGRSCGSEYFGAAGPLSRSQTLDAAALRHSRDMARRRFFEHRGSDGSDPRDRVKRAGYASRLTGENIAYGPVSAEEVVAGWLASPGHCENIMDPRFQDIGIGIATGRGRGKTYWVQTFGAPR
jgi:uncharacterized protein YkwD